MRFPIPKVFPGPTDRLIVRSQRRRERASRQVRSYLICPEFEDAAMVVRRCRRHECKFLVQL